MVARYEYGDGNNKVETVLKKRGEEWVCTDDSEFVGIGILPLSDSYDLDYQIYCWQQSLLNNNTFNESLDKKSDWHGGLSDVAVVARIIYDEGWQNAVHKACL